MLDKPWKIHLASLPLVVVFFGLFLRFVPWLFGSKPIENINNYNLGNTPPPEDALSFAINHGSAMYFNEPPPSEAPIFAIFVVLSFIVVIAVLRLLGLKLKKVTNAT